MVVELAAGHRQTIAEAARYLPAVLAETGQTAPAIGTLNVAAFAAAFPDGGTYEDLLEAPLIRAKVAIATGSDWSTALRSADVLLTTLSLTALADSRREVYQADMVSRPTITGYVRQLNAPSCARCVILAGKWFRWNQGFLRHPRCDCIHIPASENVAGDLTTDPYAYFQSLTPAEQARVFGKNNAKIIGEYGGDIYRVVNTQMRGVGSVSKQARRWGTPRKRVPVDAIIADGGDRDRIIRILTEQGYITGPQRAGGNLIGNGVERFATPISRPIVPGSARDRVLRARESGVRDPLDRDLMTAAERRLFDANYRLEYARRTGTLPPSIVNPRGLRGSDADRFLSFRGTPATPQVLADLERLLDVELDAIAQRLAAGIRSDGILRVANAAGLSDRLERALGARSPRPRTIAPMEPRTSSAGGGRRRPPNQPTASDAFGEPPDQSDRVEWLAYWHRRQDALPIDFQGDRLDWQEVEFFEAFLRAGQSVTYIPPRGLPNMPDFIWHDMDDVRVELKTPLVNQPTFTSIARQIRKDAPGKPNFLVDFRSHVVPPALLDELRNFNRHPDNLRSQVQRLFVFIDGRVWELPLT